MKIQYQTVEDAMAKQGSMYYRVADNASGVPAIFELWVVDSGGIAHSWLAESSDASVLLGDARVQRNGRKQIVDLLI